MSDELIRHRRSWADLSEALPVDVLPCSNGEFLPPPPSRVQRAIHALADAETERWRRRMGMDRRSFVRTAAAMAVGFWAIDMVGDRRFGSFARGHNTPTTGACDLEWAGRKGLETLANLPGEFVFDVQSHHVDPAGLWRVANPAFHAAFVALWPQAGPLGDRPSAGEHGVRGFGGGELDPIENLSRFHYLKELFLDSATTATVLSCVPTGPDENNPLPIAEAAETVRLVNELARSQRTVMHAFVMPNRGSMGSNQAGSGVAPAFLQAELDLMEERAKRYRGMLRGWKTYPAWGDAPYASGWFLDSEEIGHPFLEHVVRVSERYGVPPVVAVHKGFALPGFDQRAAAPRDVGPAARAHPKVRFLIYHSGHDLGEGPQRPYAGDANVGEEDRTVDAFIRSLRKAKVDAPRHGGNSPNVYAELGSVWRDYMHDPSSCAHLLGKLIRHVGPKRIVWGTDSLWYGSPHAEIVALRRFDFTREGRELYGLPHGLEGDVDDPTKKAPTPDRTIRNAILGRNAAEAYGVDPDARRRVITCDQVEAVRDGYLQRAGTLLEAAPLASNVAPGARTPAEVLADRRGKPWTP